MSARSLHVAFGAILLGTLVLTGCGPKTPTVPPPPPTVLVTAATKDNVPIYGEAIATLEGSTTTEIHAQVSGYLLKQAYTEGAQVKQGDLLFQIDPKTYQADLDKAQASLVNMQAQLKRTQEDLARYAALVKSGAVSQQEYQNEVQAVQSAQANVDGAQASVVNARISLGYTQVTAPISGIAGKAVANVGDLINPQTTMTTLSALDPIKATFTLPEQFYLDHAEQINQALQVPLEKRPQNMELVLGDGSAYPQKGCFYYIDRAIQTSTGAITAYALFPNAANLLRPGQYGKVRAVTQRLDNAVLIPQRAVSELQGIDQVVVVKPGNVVEFRNVTLGEQVGPLWVVTAGLQAGEEVVVEGLQKCVPGGTVTPQPYVAPAPTATTTNAPAAGSP